MDCNKFQRMTSLEKRDCLVALPGFIEIHITNQRDVLLRFNQSTTVPYWQRWPIPQAWLHNSVIPAIITNLNSGSSSVKGSLLFFFALPWRASGADLHEWWQRPFPGFAKKRRGACGASPVVIRRDRFPASRRYHFFTETFPYSSPISR